MELVENKTNKVIVCFRGNLDAGRALGLDRKKVGRACQSYGAPFEIKFSGYHLRYKKPGQPLVAYEYGKHKEDFILLDETHEERMERWERTFKKDLLNPPNYPFKRTPKGEMEMISANRKMPPEGEIPDYQKQRVLHGPFQREGSSKGEFETATKALMGEEMSDDKQISDTHEKEKSSSSISVEEGGAENEMEDRSTFSEDPGYIRPTSQSPKQMNIEDTPKMNPTSENSPEQNLTTYQNENDTNLKEPIRRNEFDYKNIMYETNEIPLSNIVEENRLKTSSMRTNNPKPTTYLHPSTPVTLQKPSTRHEFDHLCIICQETKAQVIFHPCHHCVICPQCDNKGLFFPKFCPICRMSIQDRVSAELVTFVSPRIYSAYSFM